MDCTDYDPTQTLLFGNTSQTPSNKFKIINASIDSILSSNRFDKLLFYTNSFISKSEFNQEFSFLQSTIFVFTYIFIIVISYFILTDIFRYTGIWWSCDFVCLCFFDFILSEVRCKFIITYIYILLWNQRNKNTTYIFTTLSFTYLLYDLQVNIVHKKFIEYSI